VTEITERMVIAIPMLDLAMDKPVIMAVWPATGNLARLTEDSVDLEDYLPYGSEARDAMPVLPGLYVWEGRFDDGYDASVELDDFPMLNGGEWRKVTPAEFESLNHGETPPEW